MSGLFARCPENPIVVPGKYAWHSYPTGLGVPESQGAFFRVLGTLGGEPDLLWPCRLAGSGPLEAPLLGDAQGGGRPRRDPVPREGQWALCAAAPLDAVVERVMRDRAM